MKAGKAKEAIEIVGRIIELIDVQVSNPVVLVENPDGRLLSDEQGILGTKFVE